MKNGRAIEKLELSKRYLENAKEDLKKAKIDKERKAMAYLLALEALKALFINYVVLDEKEMKKKLNKVEMYYY